MADFTIYPKRVELQAKRLDDIATQITGVQRMVASAASGLSPIGLAHVAPSILAIEARLLKHKMKVQSMSDALERIVRRFELAEATISSSLLAYIIEHMVEGVVQGLTDFFAEISNWISHFQHLDPSTGTVGGWIHDQIHHITDWIDDWMPILPTPILPTPIYPNPILPIIDPLPIGGPWAIPIAPQIGPEWVPITDIIPEWELQPIIGPGICPCPHEPIQWIFDPVEPHGGALPDPEFHIYGPEDVHTGDLWNPEFHVELIEWEPLTGALPNPDFNVISTLEPIHQGLETLTDWFTDITSPVTEAVHTGIENLQQWISNAHVGQPISGVVEPIIGTVQTGIEAVQQWISGPSTGPATIGEVIHTGIENVQQWVSNIGQIAQPVVTPSQTVQQWVSNAVSTLTETVHSSVESLQGWASDVVSGVSHAGHGAAHALYETGHAAHGLTPSGHSMAHEGHHAIHTINPDILR